MSQRRYQYALELSHADGRVAGQVPAQIDWEPAIEYARFKGIRQGRLPAVTAPFDSRVEPVWDPKAGKPYACGARIHVRCIGAKGITEQVVTPYFRDAARKAAAHLLEQGALEASEKFTYRLTAFPAGVADRNDADPALDGLQVEQVALPIERKDEPIEPLLNRSVRCGHSNIDDDMPVIIPQDVVGQAKALSAQAGTVETGGVLIGHLQRDTVDRLASYICITAQIPARRAVASATKLSFNSETWADVHAALQLRNSSEQILGWWHSHPDWCKDCDPQRRQQCPLGGIFFSAEDCALQRTVFSRAYQFALLISERGGESLATLFGWRQGVIGEYGFYLMDGDANHAQLAAVTIGGNEIGNH